MKRGFNDYAAELKKIFANCKMELKRVAGNASGDVYVYACVYGGGNLRIKREGGEITCHAEANDTFSLDGDAVAFYTALGKLLRDYNPQISALIKLAAGVCMELMKEQEMEWA